MNPLTIFLLSMGLWPLILAAIGIALGLWLLWRSFHPPSPAMGAFAVIILVVIGCLLSSCSTTEGLSQTTGYHKTK